MRSPESRTIEIEPDTPIASAVTRARAAFARADTAGVDAAYREAVRLAADARRPELWSALATDHTAQLWDLKTATLALERCTQYLDQAGPEHIYLRLLHATIRSTLGDHSGAQAEAAAIRAALGDAPHALAPDDTARLHRLEGLAEAARGDPDTAAHHLAEAQRAFREAGNLAGEEIIDADRIMLAVRDGDERAVRHVVSAPPSREIQDLLTLVIALKRELRYEEALKLLVDAVETDFDPALRYPVLWELTVLLRLTHQDDAADRLIPYLWSAAAASPDPEARLAAAARLSGTDIDASTPEGFDPGSAPFDQGIQHARRLVIGSELQNAEDLLILLHSRARTERDFSTWHLAAGEIELARNEHEGAPSLRDAIGHLSLAADHATGTSLVEVRAYALHQLGNACEELAAHDLASECWAEACRLEEYIANRQLTDGMRIRMLHAIPDVHDSRISAAAKALDRIDVRIRSPRGTPGGSHSSTGVQEQGSRRPAEHTDIDEADEAGATARAATTAAQLVVAMEAARGATLLAGLLPEGQALFRDLPKPSDFEGAGRWLKETATGLPRAQAAWIMHATPTHVHHAVIGRELLYYVAVPADRGKLSRAVDELMGWWAAYRPKKSADARGENIDGPAESVSLLERSIKNGKFDAALAEIAGLLGVGEIVAHIPPDVRRIAIVAGGRLADIPFVAVPIPGDTAWLGHRFALSDLPCLSARLPLHRRSGRRRGEGILLVRPPDTGLTWTRSVRARTVLKESDATSAGLRVELKRRPRRHRQVRIDTHGRYDEDDSTRSLLQLKSARPGGLLGPAELQEMDLSGCGTLVLGACESGMSKHVGRDERTGFVRAALQAGAASVVAARWIAANAVTDVLLHRFQHYLRYLPRDVALQRAQLDVYTGAFRIPAPIPSVDHPAWWACWTVYGDSGWQTRAGPVRRLLRHSADALATNLRRAVASPAAREERPRRDLSASGPGDQRRRHAT